MDFKIDYEQFVAIYEPQLLANGLPEIFWKHLHNKLTNEILDAGHKFEVVIEEGGQDGLKVSNVVTLTDLQANDPENIFLIDHAWTFRPNTARLALNEVPGLKERMMAVFDIKEEDFKDGTFSCSAYFASSENEEASCSAKSMDAELRGTHADEDNLSSRGWLHECVVDKIMESIWCHAQTYSVQIRDAELDENQIPVWYLPDEFGMSIAHSLQPNAKMVPFFFLHQNVAYSLLFLLNDVPSGVNVTRNYIDNFVARKHPDWQQILLHPWLPMDFSMEPVFHAPKSLEYFMGGRLVDLVASKSVQEKTKFDKTIDDEILVCASDLQLINNFKRLKVREINNPMEADIVWRRQHFYDFKGLAEQNSGALINQFPFESILTVKDLFAAAIQSVFESAFDEATLNWTPSWFPVTFNLDMELPQFVAYFQRRALCKLDNTWIVKPWNLARGLDTHVTRNLNAIIRLAESGPKIVSKYIQNPLLFRRPDNGNFVKFDLRYIIFVRSLAEPMDVLIFNKFWVRFAINEFALRNLDDVYTHITVHNYSVDPAANVLDMRCEDFIERLLHLYPRLSWQAIQEKINSVLREVIRAVTKNAPPRGIALNKQSRAMYGVDLMLYWRDDQCVEPFTEEAVEVAFIEGNFMPDCERACKYYEDFADVTFETLFFAKNDPTKVTPLF